MTTSYHGPFTIDVDSLGYPYKKREDYPLEYRKNGIDKLIEPLILGHLWYSDKAIGEFVKKFETSHPTTLFAFTGDHYSRRYFNSKPNLYESSSVPFILYGKNIKKGLLKTQKVGNHLDIFPTIFEMISPVGTPYYSFGKSLSLDNNQSFSYGYRRVINPNETIKISKKGMTVWDKNHTYFKSNRDLDLELKRLKDEYINRMGISWDITQKGYLSK
ncbi:Phosphoglycerol transferase I [hydrothermal vent metagenome]|uniref:Phosphoglycerol transferase I n=1 Tax=hydrothermal vent metagenome TaxID=652676 RepID=A0A1W1EKS9_9ZZZZ